MPNLIVSSHGLVVAGMWLTLPAQDADLDGSSAARSQDRDLIT